MYREPKCQSRVIEDRFIALENQRRKTSIKHVKKAVDNSWFTATDPKGNRIKTAVAAKRTNGMNYRQLLDVERQN